MEKLSETEKSSSIRIFPGDCRRKIRRGKKKSLSFKIDLGRRTKAKPHPKLLCNDEPGIRTMRNRVQSYTVKSIMKDNKGRNPS